MRFGLGTLFPEQNMEGEKVIETKIVLEFMRHGKRDKDDPRPDEKVRLNQEGRQMAQDKGRELNPQAEVAVAWGSQLERAQETSLHAMLPEIDVNASLEEMEELIAEEQKVGKKLVVDARLGYDLSGPSGEESLKAFKEGRYLSHMIEKSDQLAIEMNDKISTTYIRHAGNLAELIYRYSKIGNNFNRIASEQKGKYDQFGNQLERYLGTHSGITELFLAKVMEKNGGTEKRDEFIKSLGNGFKETEGMRVEISNTGKGQKILIQYEINGKKEELTIDEELLKRIIQERKEFEEKVS